MAPADGADSTEEAADSATQNAAPRRRFFTLVDQLRGIAALLIVYSHLVGNFLDSVGRQWTPSIYFERFFTDPLNGEIHLGWLAVALFFLISGFVITQSATAESTREFAVKRLLRVYPPVIFATLVAAVFAWCGVLVSGLAAAPGWGDVAMSAGLVNYIVPGALVLVAVGWTLVVEVLFYLLVGVVRPLLTMFPAAVPLVLLAVCFTAELVMPPAVWAVHVVAYLAFVPALVMGQIIYLTALRKIPPWAGALLLVAAWVVYVFGMQRADPSLALPHAGYFANLALAGATFAVAVLADGRVAGIPLLAVVARRSFSLYLLHVPVGFTVLSALVVDAHWAYSPALAVALVATAAATELSYRFVELPSIAVAKRISRRIRRPRQLATGEASA